MTDLTIGGPAKDWTDLMMGEGTGRDGKESARAGKSQGKSLGSRRSFDDQFLGRRMEEKREREMDGDDREGESIIIGDE